MSELPISTIKQIVFGDDLEQLDKSDPDSDTNADIKQYFHDAEVKNKTGGGASAVLDLPIPNLDDDGDFYKAPRVVFGVSNALAKTGDAAFVRVLAKIRSVFDGHPEEYEQAVQLVTKVRAEARAQAIASA